VWPNRALRQAGMLAVRDGPFGEQLDLCASRAFAVCDHQLAHVYINDPADVPQTRELFAALPGVARVLAGDERHDIGLRHQRSGEIMLLSQPDAWFAYPFWLDDKHAPDYARTVAIHAKPGFDPCELFMDPRLPCGGMLRIGRRLLAKKLGFRTKFDVVPLDPTIVRGSHGLAAADDVDRPLWIGDGPSPGGGPLPMVAVRDGVLRALNLAED